MITIDWMGLLLGLGAGMGAGALFFAGLALGIRQALTARHPARLLLVSALVRIAMVLGLGWAVAHAGPAAAIAYGLAFLAARQLAILRARPPIPEPRPCS